MHCKQEISEISHLYRTSKSLTSIPQAFLEILDVYSSFSPLIQEAPSPTWPVQGRNSIGLVMSGPGPGLSNIVEATNHPDPWSAATRQSWGGNVWMGFVDGIPSQ